MKYICIDSNIYRNIFSPSDKLPEDIKQLIDNLNSQEETKLILPLQISQEVERDRFNSWYETSLNEFKNKIDKHKKDIENIKNNYKKFKSHKVLIKEIEKDTKDLEKIVKESKTRFKNKKSKSNRILKEVFSKCEIIDENNEIIENANLRKLKRNPPRDGEDHFGDCIIWESLISYFKNRPNKTRRDKLFLVSNDKTAWGYDGLDKWLEEEWKEKTKCGIELVYNLSDIPSIPNRIQTKIKTEETKNLKDNIINDFINSKSFMDAGKNIEKLATIKNQLTKEDWLKIVKGCVSNHEIYQSFFVPPTLKELISGDDFLAIDEMDIIDDDLWNKFKKMFSLELIRYKEIPF